MKALYSTVIVLFFFLASAYAQENSREFELPQGDTTYIMKQYFMVFLHSGSERSQDSATAIRIQNAHLNHLDSLGQAGFITMVGPFGDTLSPRGIAIYDTETADEAKKMAEADPAVRANRLRVEVRPWWCAKGSILK